MTEMAARRAINLKVLASIKSLGKTKAVTVKHEKKVTLKEPGSVSIFLFFFDVVSGFDKKCLTQITNEALSQQGRWAHDGLGVYSKRHLIKAVKGCKEVLIAKLGSGSRLRQ